MILDLDITTNQMWIIQRHIIDYCNIRLDSYTKFEQINQTCLDHYDVFRASIHFKSIRNKTGWKLSGLTPDELHFIKGEVLVWGLHSPNRGEKVSARQLLRKLNLLLDPQHRRETRLKLLGI